MSECDKRAQKESKRRHDRVERFAKWLFCEHDKVERFVKWLFCKKLGFNRARLWYKHELESVVKNENFKILWHFT